MFVIGYCLCYFGWFGLTSLFGFDVIWFGLCFLVLLMLLYCYINSVDFLAFWLCIDCSFVCYCVCICCLQFGWLWL